MTRQEIKETRAEIRTTQSRIDEIVAKIKAGQARDAEDFARMHRMLDEMAEELEFAKSELAAARMDGDLHPWRREN